MRRGFITASASRAFSGGSWNATASSSRAEGARRTRRSCEVGLCHPPVGLNLYVASGIAKMGITELTVATLPWLITMLIFLILVTYVPEISLWLPRALGML